mmetsp:Transcript_50818/g.164373  ORF Transcript_50818/g.164373 Transcript_50818/m.164373 type:complete len:255 (-) Transcript_50818:347-1111(-)
MGRAPGLEPAAFTASARAFGAHVVGPRRCRRRTGCGRQRRLRRRGFRRGGLRADGGRRFGGALSVSKRFGPVLQGHRLGLPRKTRRWRRRRRGRGERETGAQVDLRRARLDTKPAAATGANNGAGDARGHLLGDAPGAAAYARRGGCRRRHYRRVRGGLLGAGRGRLGVDASTRPDPSLPFVGMQTVELPGLDGSGVRREVAPVAPQCPGALGGVRRLAGGVLGAPGAPLVARHAAAGHRRPLRRQRRGPFRRA